MYTPAKRAAAARSTGSRSALGDSCSARHTSESGLHTCMQHLKRQRNPLQHAELVPGVGWIGPVALIRAGNLGNGVTGPWDQGSGTCAARTSGIKATCTGREGKAGDLRNAVGRWDSSSSRVWGSRSWDSRSCEGIVGRESDSSSEGERFFSVEGWWCSTSEECLAWGLQHRRCLIWEVQYRPMGV